MTTQKLKGMRRAKCAVRVDVLLQVLRMNSLELAMVRSSKLPSLVKLLVEKFYIGSKLFAFDIVRGYL